MAVNSRTCEHCGAVFANRFQLGPHRRVCVQTVSSVITAPASDDDDEYVPQPLYELAQRAPGFGEEHRLFTTQYEAYHGQRTRSYLQMQQIWDNTIATTVSCVDPRFWKIYKTVRRQTIKCRDTILAVTKRLLLDENALVERGRGTTWPTSNRALCTRVTRKNDGVFWDLVSEKVTIDLKQFSLPGVESVNFEFIDPIWVCIQLCQALNKLGIHLEWEATRLVNPQTGAELFGSGIQHGLLFRNAAQTIPSNGKVLLINLSWDGGDTPYSGRGACPILVQVMNINCSSPACIDLIGYMPYIQVDKEIKGFTAAKQYLIQTCIGHILDRIEAFACHGFKCIIGDTEHLLFPRLGAMALDTMERYKYFGLRSVRACGICRLRKGRSVTRDASRHDPQQVATLLHRGDTGSANERKRCRETLMRHGIDPKKRCSLRAHARHCLVHVSRYQPSLCAGLCRYEAMHVYFIRFCSWLLETLVSLVPKNKYKAVSAATKLCWQFRDTTTGKTHPRLRSIIRLAYFSAEKRVRAVFYWAHVLGLTADVIDEPCRLHAQSAVAALQLILIATRGHRAYSGPELDIIYKDVGRQFFVHLEAMAQYKERNRVAMLQRRHESNPANNRAPVPWQRAKRSVIFLELCNMLL